MGNTAHWGSMSPPHEEESQVHSAALPQLLAFLGTLTELASEPHSDREQVKEGKVLLLPVIGSP